MHQHEHPTDPPTVEDDACAHLDMGHSVMTMTFHLGYCENVLFDWWKIRDVGTLIGSCIAIFLLAMMYELIKHYRAHLWSENSKLQACSTTSSAGKTGSQAEYFMQFQVAVKNKLHLVQTLLQVFQVVISYLLMLFVMTYNFWLCLAVVLGAGAGFFMFGWNTKEALADYCH